MSNQSNDFCTPPELVQPIKEFFGGKIDLDPCSNKNSLVKACTELMLPTNSLMQNWCKLGTTVFVNPPYAPYYLSEDGTLCLSASERKEYTGPAHLIRYTIKTWLWKGKEEAKNGCELIYLIPARGAGSLVWQDIIFPYSDAICYLKKRTPFWENGEPCKGPDGTVNPGTFDCALVYFGPQYWEFKKHFSKLGYVLIQDMALPEERLNS